MPIHHRFFCCIALVELCCTGSEADSKWKKAGADEELRHAFERVAYRLKDSGRGRYQGVNPAQRLMLEFNSDAARLQFPHGNFGLRVTGYGYGEHLRTPLKANPVASGNRVEYQRGELTEWYVNDSRGLEQGFTLAHRPGTSSDREPLVIALGIAGELRLELTAERDAVLLRSRRGAVLQYGGLRAWDSTGQALASRLRVSGREVRLVIEDRGAEYPLVVDPVWSQGTPLTPSDAAAGDNFGASVAVSGDTAVVGAPSKSVAYVFVRSGGAWNLQQELMPSDSAAGAGFGSSLSLSGDTAVVGSPAQPIGSFYGYGAAYVFVRSGGTWSQQQKLTAPDPKLDDYFGVSVSVDANTAVVGAVTKGLGGMAYVFVRSGATWSQQQALTASDEAVLDNFGGAVSVSGNTLVVGAGNKTIASNARQGAAYVFVRSGTSWSQQQELISSDGAADDLFGISVSVSEDTTVVGAFSNSRNSVSVGAAYVFVRSGATWNQQQELRAPVGANSGIFGGDSVAVRGNTAVVGAAVKPPGSLVYQNEAFVFVRRGGSWTQQQELTVSDAVTTEIAFAVAVDGDVAMLGLRTKSVGPNIQQGAAYLFTRPHVLNDFTGEGRSGALLYDPSLGQSYTALSIGDGTYSYVPNLFTSHFDTLRTGDFDDDGKADLIVYNSRTALAYIGLGNGDGTFTFKSLFWSPGYNIVETGNINGDGQTDVALYNSTTGTLYTGISNGDGTFTYQYHLVSTGFTFLRLRDFTGDGKADLFLYNSVNGLASLGIGDGAGNFAFHALSVSPGYALGDTADLNGDGKAGVILYNPTSGNTITGVSDGLGMFMFTPVNLSPGFTSVRLADYNGNGKAEVIVYNKDTGAAYFGTLNSAGTFAFQPLIWGPGYDYVVPEDVNGDGKLDVILYNSATGTEYTGISNGNGAFTYTYSLWGPSKTLTR